MEILEQVDLQPYNSLAVKSCAEYFCQPASEDELREALRYAADNKLAVSIIGGGSNILIAANPLPGLVIKLGGGGFEELSQAQLSMLTGITVLPERVYVRAAAGEDWHQFVMACLDRGWYGLENLALIPGNVGAAPIQNIGAYGVEQDEFCAAIEAMDRETGETRYLSAEECNFRYRDSRFKQEWSQRYVILNVVYALRLEPKPNLRYQALRDEVTGSDEAPTGGSEDSTDTSELSDFLLATVTPEELAAAVIRIRRRKLPDPARIPNAGSFFKNPTVSRDHHQQLSRLHADMPSFETAPGTDNVKLSAGWLIEQLGWKGERRAGAGVHADHALVLVNTEGADGEQILQLACEIQASVSERFGIQLQQEVRTLPA